MPKSYEIYDNEEVQRVTRRQASRLAGFVFLAACATLTFIPLVVQYGLSLAIAIPMVALIWCGTVWITLTRLRHLRRIVWCIKISHHRIMGYNYARRPTALRWTDVHHVDVTDRGVFLRNDDRRSLIHVTDLFAEYTELAHRLVAFAEQNGVPIHIEDEALEQLDIYARWPFLLDPSPSASR